MLEIDIFELKLEFSWSLHFFFNTLKAITSKFNNLFLAARSAPPSLSALRQKDAKEFKKAGRGKPMINVEESESVGKGGK